jgi:hypothetical protein
MDFGPGGDWNVVDYCSLEWLAQSSLFFWELMATFGRILIRT